MLVIPAIDIRGGKVVRLVKGDYAQEVVYSDDPVKAAGEWKRQGAQLIHLVDLDGALKGKPINLDIVKEITACGVPVEFGGGARDKQTLEDLFCAGVKRVVLGTKAARDPDFLKEMINEFGEKIAVGIDASSGKVKTEGWTAQESMTAVELAQRAEQLGAKTIIYTDISRDGTLTGPDVAGVEDILKQVKIDVILSGGIGSYQDLEAVKELAPQGLTGVIIGKALYDGRIKLKEAISRC